MNSTRTGGRQLPTPRAAATAGATQHPTEQSATAPAPAVRWVGWLDQHTHVLDDRQRGTGPGGQDVYRIRVTRTWTGRWRADLDYLGAWHLHGDQCLGRYEARTRYEAVTQALDLAATLHTRHDPDADLVVWLGDLRMTGEDVTR